MSEVTISRELLAYMMGKLQMVGPDAEYLRAAQDAYYRPAPVQVPDERVRCGGCGDICNKRSGCHNPYCCDPLAAAPSAPAAPSVDAERVMALVKQYAISYHYRATGLHAHGMNEAHAAVESAIRALLTPAIANQEAQDGR